MWIESRKHRGILVNHLGEVASIRSGNWIAKAQRINKDGYYIINERHGNIKLLVHRIIMGAFHGLSALTVDHIDGDKRNNRLSNLEYVTAAENSRRSHALGLRYKTIKSLE